MKKYLIIDTETTNSINDPLAYDVGFAVIDEAGEVYEAHSYIVAEIFLDEELMAEAFFADKIPQYWEDIKSGKRELRKLNTIRLRLRDCMKRWGIKTVIAHNMRFDYRSTNLTQRYLTGSKYRYFFPYGVQIWDTLKMARSVFKNDEAYGEFCYENEYLTKRGQRRYTAEILYRYLTNNNNFVESHTGLEDVMIEKEIFCECMRRGCEDCQLWGD